MLQGIYLCITFLYCHFHYHDFYFKCYQILNVSVYYLYFMLAVLCKWLSVCIEHTLKSQQNSNHHFIYKWFIFQCL